MKCKARSEGNELEGVKTDERTTGPAVTDSDPDKVRPHEGLPCS